jgi:uncharacterized membrane protein
MSIRDIGPNFMLSVQIFQESVSFKRWKWLWLAFALGSVQTLVFQFTLLGVCMLVIFLALLTVLFYLDRIREALVCCATFALINLVLTLTGLMIDERWYGLGFTAAAGVAAVIASTMANKALRQLDYHTFTSQPIYP